MKIRYIIALAAAFLLASCVKNDVLPLPSPDEPISLGFDMTRADPTIGSTFGFMVYYNLDIEPISGLYGTGTYRYDPGERATLIPCATDSYGVPLTADDYTYTKGVNIYYGYDINNNYYDFISQTLKCYMYSPGIEASLMQGSARVRYTLDCPLKFCDAPFEFNVWAYDIPPGNKTYNNYRTITVPPVVRFKNMISRIDCQFVQQAGDFTIANCKVLYLGDEAYYHPVLRMMDIFNQSESTFANLPLQAGVGLVKYVSTKAVDVFPADYSLEAVKSLVLRFDINLGAGVMTKDIPISFKMEPNMEYHFNIDVTSKLLTVTYTVTPVGGWDNYNGGSDGVGSPGFTKTLGTFPILSTWDDSGENTTIG